MREPSESKDRAFLFEVERARSAARLRFQALADIDCEPTGVCDPENPPMTDEELSALRPTAEVHPRLVASSLARKAGRPKSDVTKTAISLRLDREVVDALRARGSGWQTQANALLRAALGLTS